MKKMFQIGLKKRVITALVAVMVLASLCLSFSGCSSAQTLYLFNYGDYISPEVYDLFEQETGIRVVYDEYAAPEDMYAKFTAGSAQYDLICTSDYMLEKLIAENYLAPINFDNVPNFKNIAANQINATKQFDPDSQYTVPHFWGTLGILYNTKTVSKEAVSSWKCVFDGSFAGKMIMPNSERDAFFVALSYLGYDTNTTDAAELQKAADLLAAQKNDVQAYLLDEAARVKLEAGNADIAVIYNGEAHLAMENNEDLAFIVPSDGVYMWLDSFAIPANAANAAYAEQFLDFLCREDIAMMNFEYIYYSTPNQAVINALDEELLANPAIFPDEETMKDASVFRYLGSETEALYSQLWKYVKS